MGKLSKEQEIQLFRMLKYQEAIKNLEAQKELKRRIVSANQEIVEIVYKKIVTENIYVLDNLRDDLMQEGYIALYEALDKFSPEKAEESGAAFSSFAYMFVWGRMKKCIARDFVVRMPDKWQTDAGKVKGYLNKVYMETGRTPVINNGLKEELMEQFPEIPESRMDIAINYVCNGTFHYSIEYMEYNEPKAQIRAEKYGAELENIDGELDLNTLLNSLDEVSRNIVVMHVLEGFNFREVAEKVEKNYSTVKDWYARAIIKLKRKMQVVA